MTPIEPAEYNCIRQPTSPRMVRNGKGHSYLTLLANGGKGDGACLFAAIGDGHLDDRSSLGSAGAMHRGDSLAAHPSAYLLRKAS